MNSSTLAPYPLVEKQKTAREEIRDTIWHNDAFRRLALLLLRDSREERVDLCWKALPAGAQSSYPVQLKLQNHLSVPLRLDAHVHLNASNADSGALRALRAGLTGIMELHSIAV